MQRWLSLCHLGAMVGKLLNSIPTAYVYHDKPVTYGLRSSVDLESMSGFGGVLGSDGFCRRQPALHCTGAVYWKPAPRCFHQVSQHCERDLFQRRAAEKKKTLHSPIQRSKGETSASKVAESSGEVFVFSLFFIRH
eukprot:superscaffoldBa00000090_g1324